MSNYFCKGWASWQAGSTTWFWSIPVCGSCNDGDKRNNNRWILLPCLVFIFYWDHRLYSLYILVRGNSFRNIRSASLWSKLVLLNSPKETALLRDSGVVLLLCFFSLWRFSTFWFAANYWGMCLDKPLKFYGLTIFYFDIAWFADIPNRWKRWNFFVDSYFFIVSPNYLLIQPIGAI